MASPIETLPGGLLDHLAATRALAPVASLCAAGAYPAALHALDRLGPWPATAAWRCYVWHCHWLGLPDGTSRPLTSLGGRVPPNPPEAVPGTEVWLVGHLLTNLRTSRATLAPDMLIAPMYAAIRTQVMTMLTGQLQAGLAAFHPGLHGHLYLLAADLAARAGDAPAASRYWVEAWSALTAAADHRGLAAALVVSGDMHTALLTSPVNWNFVLATAASTPGLALPGAIEAAEFTGRPGRPDLARAAYDEAAGRYAVLGDQAGLSTVELRRAYLAVFEGAADEAIILATRAHRGFAASGRPLDAAVAATHRTLAAIAAGELPPDPAAAGAVVDARAEIGPGPALGLGLLYARLGRYWAHTRPDPDRAAAALDIAERILAGLGAEQAHAQTLVEQAGVAASLGNRGRLDRLTAAAQAGGPADPLDPRWMSQALLTMERYRLASQARDVPGMERAARELRAQVEPLRERLPEFDPARRLVAEQLLTQLDELDGGVAQLLYRARQAQDEGEDQRARTLFAQARAALPAMPPRDRAKYAAFVQAYEGDQAGAAEAYERAIWPELAEPEPRNRRMTHDLALIFQLNAGHAGYARRHLDELRATAEPWWSGLGPAWRYLHLQGRLADLEGDPGGARTALDQALDDLEQIRRALHEDDRKTSFYADRDVQDVYLDAARVALDRGDTAAAFGYAERARGRALLDLMSADRGVDLAGLPPDLVRRWREAQAGITIAEDRLTRFPLRPNLRAELDAARRYLATVEDELRHHDPRFWSTINPQADVAPLDRVAGALPPNGTLIQYMIARSDLLAWAITRDGMIATHHRSGRNNVEVLTNRFVHACATGGRYQDEAARLADLLLAPLTPAIDAASALLIVPAGPTLRLPFAALPWHGVPLGHTKPLTTLPSGSTLCTPVFRPRPTGPALIVGDPAAMAYTPAPGAPPVRPADLPAARTEAAGVAALHPGATLLIGAAATEDAVRRAISQAPVVHLATHGLLDPLAPLASAVLLADGQSLTAAELLGLRLTADLVVLSACHTGTGQAVTGDELLGLSRALLAAGARAAVVSLWAVDDRSAAQLMIDFHRNVAAGAPLAAALQQASAGLSAGRSPGPGRPRDVTVEIDDVSYEHPYHWAPFILVTTAP